MFPLQAANALSSCILHSNMMQKSIRHGPALTYQYALPDTRGHRSSFKEPCIAYQLVLQLPDAMSEDIAIVVPMPHRLCQCYITITNTAVYVNAAP